MEVRNSNFAAFIDIFTSNTYVMVVMSDPSIRKSEPKETCLGQKKPSEKPKKGEIIQFKPCFSWKMSL